MVQRIIPCKECRRRRRKCSRTSLYDTCSRCKRLELECIGSEEYSDCIVHDQSLTPLQKQVEELNLILKEMERQAKSLVPYSERNKKDNDNDKDKDIGKSKQLTASNGNINKKPWTLTFRNGTLCIETGIHSISDLLENFLPMQYLSPVPLSSKNADELVVQFDSGKSIRFIPLTIELLVKCITPAFKPISFLSPASLDIDCAIEELINVYFSCRNTYKPLIHQNTFMQYYRELTSPLESLICLSICCAVCAIPCNHTAHDPHKFRQLGDFFFDLAKDKLMNQFDEPKSRLENLVSINLLRNYMLVVLKLKDFKRFVTIGYQICLDLDTWFESTKDQGKTVEKALFTRHFSEIIFSKGLLSLIINEPMVYPSTVYHEWLLMDDEPKETADFVTMQNHLMKLINHPYMIGLKAQIHYQSKDDSFSLKFESIVRLDDVLKEWWKGAPSKYQICDDWLNLEESKAAIDKCQSDNSLALFNGFLVAMIDIYTALLQPNALGTSNDQVLSVVQELSLKRSLHCCQLLIYSQYRSILSNSALSCHSILDCNDYIVHTFDALILLVFSTNDTVRTEAREILSQTYNLINNVPFMYLHRVDPSRSPLLASVKANDLNSIDLSEYFSYPQPWFAMLYDVCHHLDKVQIVNDKQSFMSSN